MLVLLQSTRVANPMNLFIHQHPRTIHNTLFRLLYQQCRIMSTPELVKPLAIKKEGRKDEKRQQATILERELEPVTTMLEYYEVEEEGVDVPMMVEQEPYLLKDIQKRSLSTLSPDELIEMLKGQRAKDIVCIKPSTSTDTQQSNLSNCYAFTIICSPYNKRHGKALDIVVRTFMKRNFYFEDSEHFPRRRRSEQSGGWYSLDLRNVALHIIEENLRRRYDLESLFLGLDEDEDNIWCNSNEYRIPQEFVQKYQIELESQKRPRKLKGSHCDQFFPPHC